jgi:hypothetical protein
MGEYVIDGIDAGGSRGFFFKLKDANSAAKQASKETGYARVRNRYTNKTMSEWYEGKRDETKRNPGRNSRARKRSKSLTLRNMALVTIKRLPGGAVAVSGRKMAGRRANPKRKPAKRR